MLGRHGQDAIHNVLVLFNTTMQYPVAENIELIFMQLRAMIADQAIANDLDPYLVDYIRAYTDESINKDSENKSNHVKLICNKLGAYVTLYTFINNQPGSANISTILDAIHYVGERMGWVKESQFLSIEQCKYIDSIIKQYTNLQMVSYKSENKLKRHYNEIGSIILSNFPNFHECGWSPYIVPPSVQSAQRMERLFKRKHDKVEGEKEESEVKKFKSDKPL